MTDPGLPMLIASLEKNASEQIRVSLDEFRGRNLLDVRVFSSFSTGEPTPTKKGLSIRIEMLDDLLEALTKAKAQADAMGWV